MLETLTLMLIGALTGILAGLLGVGGGLVVVPALAFWLPLRGIGPADALHAAVATSLASICVTSIASAWAHYRRGAVDLRALAWLTPGLLLGSSGGALVVAGIPAPALTLFVAGFCLFAALQVARPRAPQAHTAPQLPVRWLAPGGLAIGAVSAAVGIGGGSLTVPFLTWCNVSIRQAVATSAACGLPIALAGSIGFVVTGLNAANLPAWSLGYVYGPALAGIAFVSMLSAPLGAKFAHTLPTEMLKKIFAGFLALVGVKMLLG